MVRRAVIITAEQDEWLKEEACRQKRSISNLLRLLLDSQRESMEQIKEPPRSQPKTTGKHPEGCPLCDPTSPDGEVPRLSKTLEEFLGIKGTPRHQDA